MASTLARINVVLDRVHMPKISGLLITTKDGIKFPRSLHQLLDNVDARISEIRGEFYSSKRNIRNYDLVGERLKRLESTLFGLGSRTSYMFWLGEEGENLRPTSTIRESSDPVRIPDMFDPAHSWDVVI